MPNYVHSHDLGMMAGGWGPDWPDAYGWGWALFDGKSIVPAGNTNIAELNDPAVNSLFLQLEDGQQRLGPEHHLRADRHAGDEGRGDPAGGLLQGPAVPAPDLTNVFVQTYYGMYDYGTLGSKS